MKSPTAWLALAALAVLALIGAGSAYTVSEMEQVIVTQFGRPIGEPVTEAGLHLKIPFIQEVNRLDSRFLGWDGPASEMPTKDKTYIVVDSFARWRIRDATQYFLRLRDERSALSRLDDILGSETRNTIARHELIEVIRTTRDRTPARDALVEASDGQLGILYPVEKGRAVLEEEVFTAASPKLAEFGIELLDVRFKRINYHPSVQQRIYERMISERQQIAERFRSEGQGEAAKILGRKERDLLQIASESYRRVQEIRGEADARAIAIYAAAYNRSPEAAAFYGFLKTLETYRLTADDRTTLILSTASDLYRLLRRDDPGPYSSQSP